MYMKRARDEIFTQFIRIYDYLVMLINIEIIHHHGLLYLLALTVSSFIILSIMVWFAVASRYNR